MILDEATAYTDPENEAILQNSIAKLVAGEDSDCDSAQAFYC